MFNFNYIKIKGIILIALIITIFASFFYFINKPKMKLVVLYDNIPSIDTSLLSRIDVHYRGYNVGKVRKIMPSKDKKHIEFYVDINYDDLILPSNITMMFKTENIGGKKYLDIEPPKVPSGFFLSDGDIVIGKTGHKNTDEYLIEETTSKKPEKLTQNLREMTDVLKVSFANKDNQKFLDQSAGDLAVILENLKEIISDPVFKNDIKPSMNHSSGYLKCVDRNRAKSFSSKQNTPISETLTKINQTISEAHKELSKTSILLTESNDNNSINNNATVCSPTLADNAEKQTIKANSLKGSSNKDSIKKTTFLRLVFGGSDKAFNANGANEFDCTNTTAKK